jgi:tetratricopeptide (TPR) repeat protein
MLTTLHAMLLTVVLAGPADARPMVEEARRVEQLIDARDLVAAARALKEHTFPELVRVTLEGRLALAEGEAALAERRFRRAMELAPHHAPLRILRAHALLAQKRNDAVIEVLAHDDLDAREPAVALLLAAAHEGANDPASAYAALRSAAHEHTRHVGLRRELVLLCARHGLFSSARTWASTIAPSDLGRDVALAVLQQLRAEPGGLDLARFVAAGFPDDADVQGQLGWVASAAGRTREAAAAFERATTLGADLAHAAAEHWRAAGRHRRALAINTRVDDPKRRAEQRFDILFESGAMARAIVAGDELAKQHGLTPRRRYDMAYAHYVLRQHAEATTHARALATTEEAARAEALLRAMGR